MYELQEQELFLLLLLLLLLLLMLLLLECRLRRQQPRGVFCFAIFFVVCKYLCLIN